MKVEFVRETTMGDEPWFSVYVDGVYKTGSYREAVVKKVYDDIIATPDMLKKQKEVLYSAEIFVSSENIKTQ
jgi:hypothetical protein